MKKFLVFLTIVFVTLSASGCSDAETASSNGPVKINLPKDNTVNGYRLEENDDVTADGETVNAENVTVESADSKTDRNITDTKAKYCANIKSKVFHKADCSSVKKMQEESKFYLSDRNQLIEDGYTPCKQCEP